jgi:hypothetical protein
MTKEELITIADIYEDDYFAVINEHGIIQYANGQLENCIHIDTTNPSKNLFFHFLSPVGVQNLKDALQEAGYAGNPSFLNMHLLNSTAHKAAWQIKNLLQQTGIVYMHRTKEDY